MIINLTKGFGDFPHFKLWKFPGGEIHFKAKSDLKDNNRIITRLNTSDDILALCIVVDTIRKELTQTRRYLEVFIPYFPYQQADRDFAEGECFSLKTITKILNGLDVDKYEIYDPHSDVTPALLKKVAVRDNSNFIKEVFFAIHEQIAGGPELSILMKKAKESLILLSPDAGAYKKIYKLAEKLGFHGEIFCCQKNRDLSTGKVTVVVPDLPCKDVLIIDDICVGGRTFTEIADQIKLPEECKRYLAVSHGIFSNGFAELMDRFDKVFTTNSRADEYYDRQLDTVVQKEFLSIHKLFY